MIKKEIKYLGMLCMCLLLMLIPINAEASESITGGATVEEAVEVELEKEYITTTDDGWFKILVPENAKYIGVGYDEFTEIVTDENDGIYYNNLWWLTKLDVNTCWWSLSSGNKYYYFNISTSKAENCKFYFACDAYSNNDETNPQVIQLNKEYQDKRYVTEKNAYESYQKSIAYYQFVAANSGNYKIFLESENAGAYLKITYKDGTYITNIDCKGNQKVEEIISVNAGMTYKIELVLYGEPDGNEGAISTFQVSNAKVSNITLNSNALTMNKGEQFVLTANIEPENAVDKTITYTSSNPAVATVSEEGVVTAVRGGNAEIKVDANDGSGIQAVCSVTVLPKLATRMELNDSYIEKDLTTLYSTQLYHQLEATVYPVDADDTSVTYTSSDTNVVSVDSQNGMLTLKNPGTAIITCTTNDESNLTKTCKVVLKKSPKTITLNAYSRSMSKGEQFQLIANVTPVNAVDKAVIYTSSNTSVATVSETGLITAVSSGSAVITAKFNNGNGVQAICSVTVIPKKVTSLELNCSYLEEDLETFDDEEYYHQLQATAYPTNADDTSVTYTSSDSSVVAVDKQTGILTLKKPGTAIITCKTNDGSNLTKTCKVVLKQSHLKGYKKTIDNIKYKVTSDSIGGGTVTVYGVSNKNLKSYTIQNSITIDGYTYKITGIYDRAFMNCKKATSIVLGSNIKSIGKEAFYNCKKLKTLTIKSKKIKTVGKNAFKNIYSKAKIKVPSSKLSKYKKIMKDKGQKKTVKIKKM